MLIPVYELMVLFVSLRLAASWSSCRASQSRLVSRDRNMRMNFLTGPISKLSNWAFRGNTASKRVYSFHEGTLADKELLGIKGANLCEMTRLGLPVPPGVVITTDACLEFSNDPDEKVGDDLIEQYIKGIKDIERKTGLFYGGIDTTNYEHKVIRSKMPLLLSVRSGASFHSAGLHSVLNVGMTDVTLDILSKVTSTKFAYDTYRRFLQMYGTTVLGIDSSIYEEITARVRSDKGVDSDDKLSDEDFKEIVSQFQDVAEVPQDPWIQIEMIIRKIYKSWMSPELIAIRDNLNKPKNIGTAVTIQSMVFGNFNNRSGSGLVFTRNFITGENSFCGLYLENAEGEDVVANERKPMTLNEMYQTLPEVYQDLNKYQETLERHFRDMQEIEFTVQNGTLYLLETRKGRRQANAAVKIAVSMVEEGLITEREALLRIDPDQMTFFLRPMIDPEVIATDIGLNQLAVECIGNGIGASIGASTGAVVFTNEDAMLYKARKMDVILCLNEFNHHMTKGLNIASGVLSSSGGFMSPLSSVSRSLGKPAVIGIEDIIIDTDQEILSYGTKNESIIRKGDIITIDGTTGAVYKGFVAKIPVAENSDFRTIIEWADKYKRMQIYSTVESLEEAKQSSRLDVAGVGLCSLDSFFTHVKYISLMQGYILKEYEQAAYLDLMRVLLQRDIQDIMLQLHNKDIVFQLINKPLINFLPSLGEPTFTSHVRDISAKLNMDLNICETKCRYLLDPDRANLYRSNHVSVLFPEFTEMQAEAIFGAMNAAADKVNCSIKILLPEISSVHEAKLLTSRIHDTAKSLKVNHTYILGASLDVPRSYLRSDEIIEENSIGFVSMTTDTLSKHMFGTSPENISSFLPTYMKKHLFANDPFKVIDERGVGELISSTIFKLHFMKPGVKIGVSGSHSTNSESIKFFDKVRVDYVTCPPNYVPVAKIAAAQAHITEMQNWWFADSAGFV